MNKILATTILTATALASCNVSDDIRDDAQTPVRLVADIAKTATPATRAAGTAWAAGDAIGVFMMQSGSALEANCEYTTSGSAAFTAAAGDIYYPMDGSTVDFIAYYPYEGGAALGAALPVAVETVQTDANQPAFDLLYSDNSTGHSKTSGAVALEFDHMLAKIVLNCKAAANVGASLDGMAVSIKGMNTVSSFNLATGALGVAETPAAIAPRKITTATGYEASFDAIVLPCDYTTGVLTVEFTVGGDTFTWDVGAESFGGGNEYVYEVTITRAGAEVNVSATGTIHDWTTNDGGTGAASAPAAPVTPTALTGIAVPVKSEAPDTTANDGTGYTASIERWIENGAAFNGSAFDAEKVYSAVVRLTVTEGYTFKGFTNDNVQGFLPDGAEAIVLNGGSGVHIIDLMITYPETEVASPIIPAELKGIVVPVAGELPNRTIDVGTGTGYSADLIAWQGEGYSWLDHSKPFEAGKAYMAVVKLTATAGYTLEGFDTRADYAQDFKPAGDVSIGVAKNSTEITIWIYYPETE